MPTIRSAAFAALATLALAACSVLPPRAPYAAPVEPAPVLLISIDGFRDDYLDRGLTPHLSRIAREGVRAEWMNPSYPSLTFPNHYTLVTGLRPDRHGIVHNTMRDVALGAFKPADTDATGDGRWWGGEPIWVGMTKTGLPSASMMWPGAAAEIQGARPTLWEAWQPDIPLTTRMDTIVDWLSQPSATRPRLTAWYIDVLDKAGHDHGPNASQTNATIAQVDATIGHLLDAFAARGLRDRVDLIIVSDHGMAEVGPQRAIAVEDMVDPSDVVLGSVGQSLGFTPKPGRERAVEKRLLGAHPQYDCWRKGELPPRWAYGRHSRIPAIVCQMHEGWDARPAAEVAKQPTDAVRGSHGYDPALPSMRALFIARGPSFRRGVQLPAFDNVDVYPLLARLVGIAPAASDGDITPLLPALNAP